MKNKNIKLLKISNFSSNLIFMLPFLTPFFMSKSLSASQIMLMQSFYMLAIVILEVPSGIFSDILGRKNTLIISYVSICFAWISLFFSVGFKSLLIYQLFYAIGVSFASGTYHSYLYEIVKKDKNEDAYKQLLSSMESNRFIAMALSAIFGGFIYTYFDFRGVIIFTIIASLISSFCIFLIDNIETCNKSKTPNKFKILKDGYRNLFKNKTISIVIIESIAHAWVVSAFFNFHLILLKDHGFLVSLNGIYTTIIFVISSLVMKNYKKIESKANSEKNIVLIANCTLALLTFSLIFIKNPYILALIWILMFSCVYIKGPAISNMLNSQIENENRATSLSIISLVKNLGGIVLASIFGSIYSLPNGFSYIASFCILSVFIMSFIFYLNYDNNPLQENV